VAPSTVVVIGQNVTFGTNYGHQNPRLFTLFTRIRKRLPESSPKNCRKNGFQRARSVKIQSSFRYLRRRYLATAASARFTTGAKLFLLGPRSDRQAEVAGAWWQNSWRRDNPEPASCQYQAGAQGQPFDRIQIIQRFILSLSSNASSSGPCGYPEDLPHFYGRNRANSTYRVDSVIRLPSIWYAKSRTVRVQYEFGYTVEAHLPHDVGLGTCPPCMEPRSRGWATFLIGWPRPPVAGSPSYLCS
jgi:hypothetical protein